MPLKKCVGLSLLGIFVMTSLGCSSFMMNDFDKATRISTFEVGRKVRVESRIFEGAPQLIFVVPGHACKKLPDRNLSVKVSRNGVVVLNDNRRLSELDWSHAIDSCDAYGYVRETVGGKPEKSWHFNVDDANDSLVFEIDSTQIEEIPARTVSVWVIYGDRVPGRKIYQ